MRKLYCILFPFLIIHTSSAQKVKRIDCLTLKEIIGREDFKKWFDVCDGRNKLILVDTGKILGDCSISQCPDSVIIERKWPHGLKAPGRGGTLANAKDKLIVWHFYKKSAKGEKAQYVGFWDPFTNNTLAVSILKQGDKSVITVIERGVF